MDFDWNIEQGIDLTIAAVNYLTVDVDHLSDGASPANRQQQSAAKAQQTTAPLNRRGT